MATRMHRSHRVAGALVGSAVGDALGAPFEFGPPGRFSARFPSPARGTRTEMCGGGPWEPGEFTDDTQMALLVASSLVDRGGLDEADLFERFRTWADSRSEGRRHPDPRRPRLRAAVGRRRHGALPPDRPRRGQRLPDADDAGRDPVLPGRGRSRPWTPPGGSRR